MAQSNVPVMQSVRAAYAFLRMAWRPAAGVLSLLTAASALQTYWNSVGEVGLSFAATLLTLIPSLMAVGALYRLAFADEHPDDPAFRPGPGGLQWGGMEWRLLGATMLLVLFFMIAALLFFFLLIIAVVMLAGSAGLSGESRPEDIARAVGAPGGILLILLLILLGATFLYVAVRLALVAPATASSGKVMVFETWPLTKGQFWRLLAALLLVALPSIGVSFVTGVVVSAAGEEGSTEAARVLSPAVAAPLALITGVVTGFVQTPLSAGLAAYLYRGLRPVGPTSPVVETFA